MLSVPEPARDCTLLAEWDTPGHANEGEWGGGKGSSTSRSVPIDAFDHSHIYFL